MLLTRMLVTQRLVSPKSTEPPDASKPIVARACGESDWPSLVAALDEARTIIASEWRRISRKPDSGEQEEQDAE
jgi:glutamate-ammonia-ligase adenylyltransferase